MQKFVVKKSKSAPLAPSQPVACAEKTVPPNAPTAKQTAAQLLAVCKSDVTTNTTKSAAPAVSHVKMSGYLKKKRNKMGGWRKLWFVLQNQLLLSYSSKEDYEKKLAPFKDVLNLVPGTNVRPTKGPRFTIETSTNLIYTYRCDNNKECSEWITALVESLGLQSTDIKHPSNKLHYSMENLSKARTSSSASPASSFMSSRSCDSIYRSQKAKLNPNLLAMQNSRMERTQNKPASSGINLKKEAGTHQVQNFRLHPAAHSNQSFEVHQINRMFSASAITSDKAVTKTNCNLINSRKSARNEHSRRRHHHHHHHRIREVQEPSKDNQIGVVNQKIESQRFDKNSNRHSMMDSEVTRFENGNCALVEQIQRISLEDDINSNVHESCVRKTSATSIASPSPSCSSSLSSGSSGVSNASTASASKFQLLSAAKDQSQSGKNVTPNTHLVRSKDGEPIYAVVNLKDKYENRARKMSQNEQHVTDFVPRRERPNSFHVVSGDYEEVLHLADGTVDFFEDDENIYEPINIPELSTKGPLWRYFSKINIDTLVEITRWKKEQQQNGKDDTTTTFADLRKRFGQHRKSIKNRMKKLYNRNGSDEPDKTHAHLNGIEINNLNGHHASGTSDSSDKANRGSKHEGFSAYFKQRDRHLFSSMLKKSRTSLTFDDAARKKIISLAALGGRNGVKNKNQCLSTFYD